MELSIIQSKIYEIRDYRIILDKDLALTYEVTTLNPMFNKLLFFPQHNDFIYKYQNIPLPI